MYLAKRLQKAGINVSLLVTVDAANGWRSFFQDRTVPGNVDDNENYYEDNISAADPTLSHGAPNIGSRPGQVHNHDKSNGKYGKDKINHMTIDDATTGEVTKRINNLVNDVKDGDKKTLTRDEINQLFHK